MSVSKGQIIILDSDSFQQIFVSVNHLVLETIDIVYQKSLEDVLQQLCFMIPNTNV